MKKKTFVDHLYEKISKDEKFAISQITEYQFKNLNCKIEFYYNEPQRLWYRFYFIDTILIAYTDDNCEGCWILDDDYS